MARPIGYKNKLPQTCDTCGDKIIERSIIKKRCAKCFNRIRNADAKMWRTKNYEHFRQYSQSYRKKWRAENREQYLERNRVHQKTFRLRHHKPVKTEIVGTLRQVLPELLLITKPY